MRPSLASLLIAAQLLLPTATLAAAQTPAPPSAAAPGPADAAPGGDAGSDRGPVIEAPVPDPFLAEALRACRDGASGDKGTVQRLQDAGWNLSVDGDTQTPFYQAFNGERDFDGIGTVDITFSLEVYPTMTEGYCSLSIDTAERKIGIADLAKVPDLKGEIRQTDDGVASNWQATGAEPTVFIQADQHKRDLYFLLDVTSLMKKPAADIPYVQPDTTDNTGGGDSGTSATD
ncbi:MAG: hypothetical protein P4M09_08895 [Devosia sp.]|nr:hypothetical protein [Devosia sp.]